MNTPMFLILVVWGAIDIISGHYAMGANLFGALLAAGLVGKFTKRKADIFSK